MEEPVSTQDTAQTPLRAEEALDSMRLDPQDSEFGEFSKSGGRPWSEQAPFEKEQPKAEMGDPRDLSYTEQDSPEEVYDMYSPSKQVQAETNEVSDESMPLQPKEQAKSLELLSVTVEEIKSENTSNPLKTNDEELLKIPETKLGLGIQETDLLGDKVEQSLNLAGMDGTWGAEQKPPSSPYRLSPGTGEVMGTFNHQESTSLWGLPFDYPPENQMDRQMPLNETLPQDLGEALAGNKDPKNASTEDASGPESLYQLLYQEYTEETSFFMPQVLDHQITDCWKSISKRKEFIQNIQVSVDGPFREESDGILPLHSFKVVSRHSSENWTSVSRRFNDLVWLERVLEYKYFGRVLPRLPPKSMFAKLGMGLSDRVLNERKEGIGRFCRKLLELEEISTSDEVFYFLFKPRKDLALYQKGTLNEIIDVRYTVWSWAPIALIAKATAWLRYVAHNHRSPPKAYAVDPQEAKKVAEKQQETALFEAILQPLRISQSLVLDCDNVIDSFSELAGQFLESADTMLKETNPVTRSYLWLSKISVPESSPNEGPKQANIRARLATLEEDLSDLKYCFQRRFQFEVYVTDIQKQMEGRDKQEFSDYSIMEQNFQKVRAKLEGFSEALDKDYRPMIARLRAELSALLDLLIAYPSS